MALITEDKSRNVIPRWRPSGIHASARELSSLMPRGEAPYFADEPLDVLVRDWESTRSPSTAADLVSVAFTTNKRLPSIRDAAEFVRHTQQLPPASRQIAARYLGISDATDAPACTIEQLIQPGIFHRQVALLKALTSIHPSNAIAWIDLARYYTVLGQEAKAFQSIRKALALAPLNRFVLRSAARFFIHIDEYDQAHHILSTTPIVSVDPWIMAAEIATATAIESPSLFVKRAIQSMERDRWAPFHISELASAVATAELLNGNRKRANKFFRSSQISPTENAVAQLSWAHRNFGIIQPDHVTDSICSAEATAWEHFLAGRWNIAISAAVEWLLDQPFSKRPAAVGAHIAWIGHEDAPTAAQFTEIGIRANPTDFGLRNNLVFYLIQANDLKRALDIAQNMRTDSAEPSELAYWDATQGLLAFRNGDLIQGRKLYQKAICYFDASEDIRRALVGSLYLATEEMRARTPSAVEDAKAILQKTPPVMTPEIYTLRRKLQLQVDSQPV